MFQSVSMFRCSPSQLSAPPLVVLLGLEVVTRVAVILGLILLIILSTLNTSVYQQQHQQQKLLQQYQKYKYSSSISKDSSGPDGTGNCTVAVASSCSLLLVL